MPTDHEEATALTHNHFLKPGAFSDGSTSINPEVLKEKFEENQNLLKRFWNRWSKEYLPIISARNKWRKQVEPLKPGDLVLMRLDLGWCRERIKDVYSDPESDQVREVTVITPQRT